MTNEEKQIHLYAIMRTELDVAILKRKGKIKNGSVAKDAYYQGLVKGLMINKGWEEEIKEVRNNTGYE